METNKPSHLVKALGVTIFAILSSAFASLSTGFSLVLNLLDSLTVLVIAHYFLETYTAARKSLEEVKVEKEDVASLLEGISDGYLICKLRGQDEQPRDRI